MAPWQILLRRWRARRWKRTLGSHLARSGVVPLLVTDARGALRLVSPAAERLFGWRVEEILGQPVHQVLGGPVPPEVPARVSGRHKEGYELDLEAIASPLRDGPGAVVLLFDLACDLPPVLADPAQVREVVTSLVRNAAEAIGSDNGVVTVQTGVRQDNSCEQVFVSVSDTGPGLPEAIRDSLFQPYASTKSLGRGLGLSAALGIVHRHAGDMEVRSYPGAGATFTVLLPATGSAAPCAADRVAAVPASAPAAS